MLTLGALSFLYPWLLAGLIVLPAIWWLLRATPPAPKRVRFPALRLLLGLEHREETPDRTPLWLVLLRATLAALLILAFAGPVYNLAPPADEDGPLVLVVDDGWPAAKRWQARQNVMLGLIDEADRNRRMVSIITTAPVTTARDIALIQPADARRLVSGMQPRAWRPDHEAAMEKIRELETLLARAQGTPRIVWLSDGIDANGATRAFAERLARLGPATAMIDDPQDHALALRPARNEAGALIVEVIRPEGRSAVREARQGSVRALDRTGRAVASADFAFAPGESEAQARIEAPIELRNEIVRIEITGGESAGAVTLIDEDARRRPVGLVSGAGEERDQPLLSNLYYVERALLPYAELRDGNIEELLQQPLAVLILADVGRVVGQDRARVAEWVESGGVLVRFAGPRLAGQGDELLPVRLRTGGRALGGALAWDTPQTLAAFPRSSPFYGLAVPSEVTVSRQVLAEPTVDLSDRTWARLSDGTPLVTAERRGEGMIVLFHVTANRQWSDLPLSGLFVQMLRRLVALSQGVGTDIAAEAAPLPPLTVLDGFGRLVAPPPTAITLGPGEIGETTPGPRHPPGLYGREAAPRALNPTHADITLTALETLPAGMAREAYRTAPTIDFKPWLLGLALLLLLADGLAALILSGRLNVTGLGRALSRGGTGAAALALAVTLPFMTEARADDDARALEATLETRLAYVVTGDREVDEMSHAGLAGLSRALFARTSVEPADPIPVDVERDELSFFPLLYWPITANQPDLSPEALARLNTYMRTGGTIMFDTRDHGAGGETGTSPETRRLRAITSELDIPALVPVPDDHVLTKAFYLMRDFPGRWAGGRVWVESPPVSEDGELRITANDGVSPVIIGGHDWAAAWAMDEAGRPLAAVVPGGERQREMALRFGINVVMYALTGNYKSDLVHVPALLERLGQ
jgi:hypothetical protein